MLRPWLSQILLMHVVLNLQPSTVQIHFPQYCLHFLHRCGLNITPFLHLLHFLNHNFPGLSLSPWDPRPGISSLLFLFHKKLLDIFYCPLLFTASSLILVPAHLSSQPHLLCSFLPHHNFLSHQHQLSSVVFLFWQCFSVFSLSWFQSPHTSHPGNFLIRDKNSTFW